MTGKPDLPSRSSARSSTASKASGAPSYLMGAALLALIVANSPLSGAYFSALKAYVGPLNVEHWINDGLMAVFFLLVGLEIKREVLDGQLSTWPRRAPAGDRGARRHGGAGADLSRASICGTAAALRGWAIPSATDIAFALGVLALLGSPGAGARSRSFSPRLPSSTTSAPCSSSPSSTQRPGRRPDLRRARPSLRGADRARTGWGVGRLVPYARSGCCYGCFVLKSGIHATLAGVALALTVPLRVSPGIADDLEHSPLHRMEHALHPWMWRLSSCPSSASPMPALRFDGVGPARRSVEAA